jgi:hypothetical protein
VPFQRFAMGHMLDLAKVVYGSNAKVSHGRPG